MTNDIDNFNAEGSIASLTSTVAHLFATAKPALASEGPIESVLEMHKRVVGSFVKLARTALKVWSGCNNTIVFSPDHGAHIDSASGHGDHGVDILEDMQLFHWYGIYSAR